MMTNQLPNIPSIHIDKIRIKAPCTHQATGKVVYFDDADLGLVPAGGATPNQHALKDGGDRAYVQSKEVNSHGMASMLEIHCCPPQVLQKHNLFGHAILQDYVYAILNIITKRLGIDVDPMERDEWLRGGIGITEIHLTANFRCPSSAVASIIQAIDDNNSKGKTRKIESCITLDRGAKRRSTYHALTIYDKSTQLREAFQTENRSKKLGKYQTELVAEASKGIRAEIKLYSQELKLLNLGYVMRWKDVDISALFFEFFNKYKVSYSIQRSLTEGELELLTKSERKAYLLWLNGIPLSEQFGRSTAWKYTKAIFEKTGIKVDGNRRPEDLPDLNLQEIFRAENILPIPSWALGTEYYFPPNQSNFPPRRWHGIGNVPLPDNLEL